MLRSLRSTIALSVLSAALGCASRKPPAAPPPRARERLGSLLLAPGVKPVAVTELPPRFRLDPAFAPLWWGDQSGLALGGKRGSHQVLLGAGGPGYGQLRVLSGDPDASRRDARLLDAAASPNGMALAAAYAEPARNRAAIVMRDFLDAKAGRTIAAFEGAYDVAQVNWLNPDLLAVMLDSQDRSPGLFMITPGPEVKLRELDQLHCRLTALSYRPDGLWAVAQGDAQTPPYLINLSTGGCVTLERRNPVRVLAWAPDSTSFLYVAPGTRSVAGVFRYDLASRRSALVAISSGAAAYSRDGSIVALGNSALTWRAASDAPRLVHLQIARWDAGRTEIQINSLGAATTPANLAAARMLFSTASDNSILDFAIPLPHGAQRELLDYSYASRQVFPLASANPAVPLVMSWSPDGKLLAIVDGGVTPNRLIVLAPPR